MFCFVIVVAFILFIQESIECYYRNACTIASGSLLCAWFQLYDVVYFASYCFLLESPKKISALSFSIVA